MIHRREIAVVALCLAISCVAARGATPERSDQTRAGMQEMVRQAQTTEQYREAAEYYRWQQQHYEDCAREEKHEWVRRAIERSAPAKYPSPENSSRYRYEYFSYEAAKMGALAARYSMLAQMIR
jgi:hypothetical protein